jgi:hypothetical protein
MHTRFEGCMNTLWQLKRGGVKLSKKVNFQLEDNTTFCHILSWCQLGIVVIITSKESKVGLKKVHSQNTRP